VNTLKTLARFVDIANERIGRAVSWLALAMVLMQFAVVVMRYVFGMSSLYMQESIVYMHAIVFLVAAGYTLAHDAHVRIDIFYGSATSRKKALTDLCGVLVILWPVCALIWITAWPYVFASWLVLETSPEGSGLPFVFLLKTVILVFATLLSLQGLSLAVKSLFVLTGLHGNATPDEEAKGAGS
jgi:TRAP-type mannitol/chloroaromatic compound transport system permease small subunit